jgi:hypothetical protein
VQPSILVGAAVVMAVGLICARLLRHRTTHEDDRNRLM